MILIRLTLIFTLIIVATTVLAGFLSWRLTVNAAQEPAIELVESIQVNTVYGIVDLLAMRLAAAEAMAMSLRDLWQRGVMRQNTPTENLNTMFSLLKTHTRSFSSLAYSTPEGGLWGFGADTSVPFVGNDSDVIQYAEFRCWTNLTVTSYHHVYFQVDAYNREINGSRVDWGPYNSNEESWIRMLDSVDRRWSRPYSKW